jgi:hypothetical protein
VAGSGDAGAFRICLASYINRQAEHHTTADFRSALLALLRAHGIEYDEKYVFDRAAVQRPDPPPLRGQWAWQELVATCFSR